MKILLPWFFVIKQPALPFSRCWGFYRHPTLYPHVAPSPYAMISVLLPEKVLSRRRCRHTFRKIKVPATSLYHTQQTLLLVPLGFPWLYPNILWFAVGTLCFNLNAKAAMTTGKGCKTNCRSRSSKANIYVEQNPFWNSRKYFLKKNECLRLRLQCVTQPICIWNEFLM